MLYHVATATDLDRTQVSRQRIEPPVPEMTARGPVRVGRRADREHRPPRHQRVSAEGRAPGCSHGHDCDRRRWPASRWPSATGAWWAPAVRATMSSNREEGDPRLSLPPKGTYSPEAYRAPVRAAPSRGSRGGFAPRRVSAWAYRTSPPATADERAKFVQILESPSARERIAREVDRVSSWVADGARERLHARGMETVQERAQGRPGGRRGPRAGRISGGSSRRTRAEARRGRQGGGCRREQHGRGGTAGGGPDGRGVGGPQWGAQGAYKRDRVRRARCGGFPRTTRRTRGITTATTCPTSRH